MKLTIRAIQIGHDRVFVQMGPDIKGYLDMPKKSYQKIISVLVKTFKAEIQEVNFDKWPQPAAEA